MRLYPVPYKDAIEFCAKAKVWALFFTARMGFLVNLHQLFCVDIRVTLCGAERGMAEQLLNFA